MKTLFISVAILALSSCAYTQLNSTSNFDSFLKYFKPATNQNISEHNEVLIPLDLTRKVLGSSIIDDNVVEIYCIGIINSASNITILIRVLYPEGGDASLYQLLTFTPMGQLLANETICSNLLDNNGGILCKLNLVNDSILEVNEECVNGENNKDHSITNTNYFYFLIDRIGFRKIVTGISEKERKFPQVSDRILSCNELKKFSKSDLDIMRNEIFASYGYIFKTKKWKEYFEKQSWYNPKNEYVLDKLTSIEKINIETLLKIAPIK